MCRLLTFLLVLFCSRLAAAPAAVSYYRLRIAFSTTSDWSTLTCDATNFITLRLMSTSGNPTTVKTTLSEFNLNQAQADAQADKSVGMTTDLAIAPPALDQPLSCVLQKGAWNASTVSVYSVAGNGGAQLIKTVNHTGTVAGNTATNPLSFTIDLSALKNTAALEYQPSAFPKMLWAFYYPWYHMSSWTSTELRDHPATLYSSDDPTAIARQIDQAQSAGIDGFIASWWGPGSYEDGIFPTLLNIALEKNFRITVYLEIHTTNGPQDAATITTWLSYVLSNYGKHPAFMKVDGKPLIPIYTAGSVPVATWQQIFQNLAAQGLEAFYLADATDPSYLEVFDGMHQYNNFSVENIGPYDQSMVSVTRDYPMLQDTPASKMACIDVVPGYDDRLIPGRKGAVQDRENGAFYSGMFDAALASNPDWIFITSWNEWWENTYIEPGQLYGDQYLTLSRQYADRWKGIGGRSSRRPVR